MRGRQLAVTLNRSNAGRMFYRTRKQTEIDHPECPASKVAERGRIGRAQRLRIAVFGAAILLLAACQSDEEKADAHLGQAMEFLAAEDLPRARIEFLNVLRATPNDIPSRFKLAEVEAKLGNRRAAYSQMLRIVEQDPRHVPSRLKLAAMVMEERNWAIAKSHYTAIANVAGDNAQVQAGLAIIAYSEAVEAGDALALLKTHARLLEVMPNAPQMVALRYAIVDGYGRTNRPQEALKAVDDALALAPDNLEFAQARLQLLNRLGRKQEVVPQLEAILKSHPEATHFRRMLAALHIEAGNIDAAEAVLRDVPDLSDTGDQLALVQFLSEYRGSEEALLTLERLVAAHGRPTVLRLLRAAMAFDNADTESALREMREAVAAAEEADEDTAGALYMLAQMLNASGDRPAAETALDTLLASAPRNVPASQLQAAWFLERGRPDLALRLLRTAQGVDPENTATLSLLARAYEASGDTALAGQIMAQAFEASGNDALTALEYSAHLVAQNKITSAIDVLGRAIERAPGNITLLGRQGELFLARQQWDQAESIEGRLRVIGTDPALIIADRMQFQRLISLGNTDLAMQHITLRAEAKQVTPVGLATLARAGLNAGRFDIVQTLIDIGSEQFPSDAELRAVAAELAVAQGNLAAAAEIYSDLTVKMPDTAALWSDFIALRKRQNAPDLLIETIQNAVQALPDSPEMQWELASALQADGQLDSAIAAYEALFETHPQSAPVRNNLAGLLLQRSQDEETLVRTAHLVEPLVGSPIPQFLDTVGRVRFLQGDLETAVNALVTAAGALPDDPQVQWHAAKALIRADRTDDAAHYLDRVIDIGTEPFASLAKEAALGLAADDASKVTD